MSIINIEQLPDSTRLWIYGAERGLNASQVTELQAGMNRFMLEWTAHKRELATGWQLKYDRFIMVAVDESRMAASGCSIDSMVRNLRHLEGLIGAEIVGTSAKVFYRDGDSAIHCVERLQFRELLATGVLNPDSIVFDNTIQTLSDLRQGNWEVPMKSSWHMKAFGAVRSEPALSLPKG